MIFRGIQALELGGLAPSQYCGKILCDLGAKVIRIDKTGYLSEHEALLGNGKLSVSIDLKMPKGAAVLRKLSKFSDVLIEPYRPGIMEKLGLGPNELMRENKRLIYVRLSGFGQSGLYSKNAGHDINFISLAGVLSLLGKPNLPPVPPCNIIGDFAAGGILAAFGIALALYEREKSGLGQVVDVSMMKGASYLVSWILGSRNMLWSEPAGSNLLDGGSYLYNVYKTKDGKWMAVGGLEQKFYNNVLAGLGLSEDECPYFSENGLELFQKKFLEKTQSEWIEIFKNLDACVTPVLSVDESVKERPTDFAESFRNRLPMPLPEPRFSRTQSTPSCLAPPPEHGQDTLNVLLDLDFTREEIFQMDAEKAIYLTKKSKL